MGWKLPFLLQNQPRLRAVPRGLDYTAGMGPLPPANCPECTGAGGSFRASLTLAPPWAGSGSWGWEALWVLMGSGVIQGPEGVEMSGRVVKVEIC